jgi:hypothetical protein
MVYRSAFFYSNTRGSGRLQRAVQGGTQNNFQTSILRCYMQGCNMDSIAYSVGEGTFELLPVLLFHRTGGVAAPGHSS